jgi:hypothetical protein
MGNIQGPGLPMLQALIIDAVTPPATVAPRSHSSGVRLLKVCGLCLPGASTLPTLRPVLQSVGMRGSCQTASRCARIRLLVSGKNPGRRRSLENSREPVGYPSLKETAGVAQQDKRAADCTGTCWVIGPIDCHQRSGSFLVRTPAHLWYTDHRTEAISFGLLSGVPRLQDGAHDRHYQNSLQDCLLINPRELPHVGDSPPGQHGGFSID